MRTRRQSRSNGVIRPVAVLERALDNSTFSMPTTLFTATDTGGVSDDIDVPLTVSETTSTDFIKNNPIVSGVINPSGTEEGRVFIFPISALDFAQIQTPARGVGPINDAAHVTGGTAPGPLVFFDHIWGFTPNTRLATQAELDGAEAAAGASATDFAGTPCGIYEGSGPFVSSASAPATWVCDDTVSSPNGYQVVQISVADFTSSPFPPTLADGSINDIDAPMILAGQIALWVPETEIQDAIESPTNIAVGSADFFNSISVEDGDAVNIQSVDDAVEPMTQGTSGPNAAGSAENNSVSAPLGAAPEPGGVGQFQFNHDIRFRPGPLRLNQSSDEDFNSEPRLRFDFRSTANGGAGNSLPGSDASVHSSNAVDGIGQTPRGATLTIHSMIGTTNNNDDNGSSGTLHGCTAFDPSHYDLVSFGSIPVTELLDDVNTFNAGLASVVSQTSVTSNSGPIAHAYYGAFSGGNGADLSSSIFPDPDGIVPIIEFTNAPLQTFSVATGARFGVGDDGLTCANSDAGPAGWIASDDPALVTTFDSDGDGVFEGITRMRVRTSVPVEFGNYRGLGPGLFPNRLSGIQVFLQALVRADIVVQAEGQELFVLQSHAYGETDADGVPNFELFPGDGGSPGQCRPFDSAAWELNGNDTDTTTGWCNNQFEDIGAVDSFDLTDTIDYDNRSTNNRFTTSAGDVEETESSGSVAQIVEASLGLSKVNLDGLNDIVDNGQTVRFALQPRVIGSSLEALTNVRLDDPLDPRFEFVQFVSGPSTPGATCSESNGTIDCRFSASNPNNPGSFEPGLPGGWSDEVIIEVRLVGGIANSDSPTVLPNEARLRSSGVKRFRFYAFAVGRSGYCESTAYSTRHL